MPTTTAGPAPAGRRPRPPGRLPVVVVLVVALALLVGGLVDGLAPSRAEAAVRTAPAAASSGVTAASATVSAPEAEPRPKAKPGKHKHHAKKHKKKKKRKHRKKRRPAPVAKPAPVPPTLMPRTGGEVFRSLLPYSGDFPDPAVMLVGSTYYAYSTTISSLNLPVMTSTDLRTWHARVTNTPGRPWLNDAMPAAASWAAKRRNAAGNVIFSSTWAPSVAPVAGRFVAAYAVNLAASPAKWCVSVATSVSPTGPFTDTTAGPLVCPSDQGAIDPQVFLDADGSPWLLWKSEGVPYHASTRLWSRQLSPDGTTFAPGSVATPLLTTAAHSWEGDIIENPAMVLHNGRYYLFYSANDWHGAAYSIGYAMCSSVVGPCTRPSATPLLVTSGGMAGPGGPSPFHDLSGAFRLAYSAWDWGHLGYQSDRAACAKAALGCNGRRLHVATLVSDPASGLLQVTGLS